MFFFKEGGVRKQIIAFWTTKTYEDVTINREKWGPSANISGTPLQFTYNGMSTFWLWDGKNFQEIKPHVSLFKNDLRNGLSITSDDVTMTMDERDFSLRFYRDSENFDFKVESISPHPPPVKYKCTQATKKLGFDTLKIYHARWKGSLTANGDEKKLEGSLYMQNICMNVPALPWLWGVFHKDDGSYLTYFTTFIGPLILRRRRDCAPMWDNIFKPFNKNLNYTPAGEKTKRFKHVKNRVIRKGRNLPEFEISGELNNEKLKVRLRTLAKCTYTFERKKIWRNKFFYNEYPSEVVYLEYTDKDGNVHRDGHQEWTGNCEHSWGILLNKK